jgi:hypothetical protein
VDITHDPELIASNESHWRDLGEILEPIVVIGMVDARMFVKVQIAEADWAIVPIYVDLHIALEL